MHYLHGRPANDTSGIKLRLSTAPVPYSAGMVAFASMFQASAAGVLFMLHCCGRLLGVVSMPVLSWLCVTRMRRYCRCLFSVYETLPLLPKPAGLLPPGLPPVLPPPQILPRTNSTLVKNSCCYSGWEPLHGFATRVHTHKMGRCAPAACYCMRSSDCPGGRAGCRQAPSPE